MSWSEAVTTALLLVGAYFFLAGTAGLLRFPDVFTRLHAVTKADNLGLGFVVAALAVQAGSPVAVAKLVVIWVLVLLAGASSCYLIARGARARQGDEDHA